MYAQTLASSEELHTYHSLHQIQLRRLDSRPTASALQSILIHITEASFIIPHILNTVGSILFIHLLGGQNIELGFVVPAANATGGFEGDPLLYGGQYLYPNSSTYRLALHHSPAWLFPCRLLSCAQTVKCESPTLSIYSIPLATYTALAITGLITVIRDKQQQQRGSSRKSTALLAIGLLFVCAGILLCS
jgi:UPF0716 family protein affecting phage T7 exclusion